MATELEKYLYYPEMSPRRPISADSLKILSIILIGLSVVGVYFASTTSPAPIYRISDLIGNYFLNYATVMIEGRLVEPVRLDVQTGGRIRLTITIQEEAPGSIPFTVFVYDPVASEYLTSPNYADFGDYVRMLIQLRVREEFTYGILQDSTHVMIIDKVSSMQPMNVTSLRNVEQYAYVCANGLVSNPRNVSTGLLFEIATMGESITVLVPTTFRYRYGQTSEFGAIWNGMNTAGSMMRVCGPVYFYRGTSPEIVVTRIQDVSIETVTSVPEISFKDLPQYVGDVIATTGILNGLGYDPKSRLYLIDLRDTQGDAVTISAPREVINKTIDPWKVGIGSRLRVIGTVKNLSEISAMQIDVTEIKPPPNTTRVIDALSNQRGSIVILWGVKVSSSSATSGGNWIIDVADETGTLRVFIPSSVARGIGDSPPSVGKYIAIAGYRDVYGQTEEIVVYTENGLREIQAPTTQPSPGLVSVKISGLGDYIAQDVSVVAELVAIRYSSSDRLYYVEIRDETGRANATMSRDLVSLIDPWRAGAGTMIRVNGTVSASNLLRAKTVEVLLSTPTQVLTIAEAVQRPYGSVVAVVNATVVSARSTSGNNWQITVTDNTGAQILIFIPSSVVAEINQSLPAIGSVISVAGYRDVYQGTEEIIVYTKTGYKA